MDAYAVVGNPISHSKSPQIHKAFAAQFGDEIQYDPIECPIDGFEACINEFFRVVHGKGLNVTVPFKEQAFRLCKNLSQRASLAGAVNTLYLNGEGELYGDNTDGKGLLVDLMVNHGVELTGKKVLVVGAGGAVRGVLGPILEQQPASVFVCNRTLSKVDALIDIFGSLGPIHKSSFEDLSDSFDVVINGTSASLGGDLPPLKEALISSETVVYDMMYSQTDTVFNAWAKKCGAKTAIDGLGMLVEQAAEAFEIWRGSRPDTRNVIKSLRNQ